LTGRKVLEGCRCASSITSPVSACLKIVTAQQPELGRRLESDVQEGLMQVAFGKLSRGTAGMYRVADPS
jgi:hypothetical protein